MDGMLVDIASGVAVMAIGAGAGFVGNYLLNSPFMWGRLGSAGRILQQSPRVVPKRGDLQEQLYRRYYYDNGRVQISGIALKGIVAGIKEGYDLVKKRPHYKENYRQIVRQVLDKKHPLRKVSLDAMHLHLLLMNPNSEFVEKRMIIEHNEHLKEDIYSNILKLSAIAQDGGWPIKGHIQVCVSNADLMFTMFRAIPTGNKTATGMLVGLLFPGHLGTSSPSIFMQNKGEQYELFEACGSNFDVFYSNAERIFIWDGDGARLEKKGMELAEEGRTALATLKKESAPV